MRIFYLLLTLFVAIITCSAQFYATGTEPWSTKWSQIETAHFQIVFPKKYDAKGQDLANYLETVYYYGGYSLLHNPKKISVIVHANSSVSNGMVAWAPKRMELYSVNPQDVYAQDWLQQLAIHEFRHVVQIDKANIGFTKVLSFLFGESAVGAVVGLYLPTWFLEGDAVVAETVLSKSGRGRAPAFQQGLRAQFLEKEVYSYEKATLGSYKDYVPNHYEIGYQLVASGRERYGSELWEHAVEKSGKAYHTNPFLRGIREVTGLNKRRLYHSITDSLRLSWGAEIASLPPDDVTINSADSLTYKNYLYPQPWSDKIVAQLESPSFTPKFVLIDSAGNSRPFLEINSRTEDAFDLKGNLMVWSEFRPDMRYTHRNYAVLRTFNLKTLAYKTISSKTRYFAPKLHPNDSTVLCVSHKVDGTQTIALLDVNSGTLLKSISVKPDEAIVSPIWSSSGDAIYAILLNNEGKRIAKFTFTDNSWSDLTKPSFTNISNLCDRDSMLLFTSNNSNQENIFGLNKVNGTVCQLTKSKFGSRYPSVGFNGELLFSSYSSVGYRVGVKRVEGAFPPSDLGFLPPQVEAISTQELGIPDFTVKDTTITSKSYSRANLFNIHSWGPYVNVNEDTYLGASVMSQNLLSNTFVTLGYNADPSFTSEKYYSSIRYSGWFPELNLNLKYGDRKIAYNNVYQADGVNYDALVVKANDTQSVLTLEPTIAVPLNFSRGRHSTFLTPMVGSVLQMFGSYNQQNDYFLDNNDGSYAYLGSQEIVIPATTYFSLKYGFSFYSLKRQSERDVWSRGGIRTDVYYQNSPLGDYSRGTMLSMKVDLLAPGFFKHDAFKFTAIFEDKEPLYSNNTRYSYTNLFALPRGYESILSDCIMTFKFDYQIPILNPDAVLSGAFYFKRLRFNLFADYCCYSRQELNNEVSYDTGSFGNDFWIDFHLFQWSIPLQLGYRLGYKPSEETQFNEILWNISF